MSKPKHFNQSDTDSVYDVWMGYENGSQISPQKMEIDEIFDMIEGYAFSDGMRIEIRAFSISDYIVEYCVSIHSDDWTRGREGKYVFLIECDDFVKAHSLMELLNGLRHHIMKT